jgi:hypothetical protein
MTNLQRELMKIQLLLLSKDFQKLEQIKNIYDSMTSDYLTAGFYSEFMNVVNYQISEIKKVFEKIKIQINETLID